MYLSKTSHSSSPAPTHLILFNPFFFFLSRSPGAHHKIHDLLGLAYLPDGVVLSDDCSAAGTNSRVDLPGAALVRVDPVSLAVWPARAGPDKPWREARPGLDQDGQSGHLCGVLRYCLRRGGGGGEGCFFFYCCC